ncbi:MAG TPA: HNH endonuclease [Ignavibacteria bacterium]
MRLIKYTVNKYHHNIPDKVVLADLRKTAKRLGRKFLSKREYDAEGEYHSSTARARFGAWNAAVSRAGLMPTRPEYVSDDELMENIKSLWDTLGRQPVYNDVTFGISRFSIKTYINYYGSWRRTLNEFKKYINGAKRKKEGVKKNSRKRTKRRKLKYNQASLSLRFKIFKRDRFTCCACGRSPATTPGLELHVDHIKPRAKGGKTVFDNLQTLCKDCNLGKGAQKQ